MVIKGLRTRKAFSLIELSIVLLIVSILVAGTATVSVAVMTKKKNELTKERMEVIYRAMGKYLLANYKIPCPAPLNVAKTSSSYGVADASGCDADGIYTSNLQADVVYGMVPVNTLGLADEYGEDGFGVKIGYAMNLNFATAEFPTATDNDGFSFYDDSGSDMMKVYSHPSGNVVDDVMFVLISHGANKFGGFNSDSVSQNSGSSSYEVDNYLSHIVNNGSPPVDTADFGQNAAYSTYVTFAVSDATSSVFDDIIFFKTRPQMLVDFNAYHLMGCDSSTTNWASGYASSFHGDVVYNSSACSSPYDSIHPSKECGPFGGVWIDRVQCP